MELIRTADEPRRYLLNFGGDIAVELPGTTDILAEAGYIDKSRYESFGSEGYYRDRGQFIHEACDLIDRGVTLSAASVEGYAGYVEAYKKARVLLQPPVAIERSLYHEALRFAGTLDRLYAKQIGDLKTAKQTAAWWRLQLAAYAILVGAPYRPLFDLQLKEDGTFRFIWITPEQYIAAAFQFLSALHDYHRKRKLPAKFLSALAREATTTLSAIQRQYGNQITVRAGQDEADRILASGHVGEDAGGEVAEDGERRERADDEGAADCGDQGDAGTGRRAA